MGRNGHERVRGMRRDEEASPPSNHGTDSFEGFSHSCTTIP